LAAPAPSNKNAPTARRATAVRAAPAREGDIERTVLQHFDVWSVLRFSAVFYLTLAGIMFVAGVVLWLAATAAGIRGNVEKFVGDLIASTKFHFVGTEVLRVSAITAAVMVLLGTAFNVFLSVVYNLISDIIGGVSVTVAEAGAEAGRAGQKAADESPSLPPAGVLLPASELAGLTPSSRQQGRPRDLPAP
jgi:hypothetical protein